MARKLIEKHPLKVEEDAPIISEGDILKIPVHHFGKWDQILAAV